jgi:hypothetical protein
MSEAIYQLGSNFDPPDPPPEPIIEDDDELLSLCCTANAYGEIHSEVVDETDDGEPIIEHYGRCSACKENSTFTDGTEE